MQMLFKVSMPHEKFNAAIKDGVAGQKMNRIIEESKPKAVYFTEFHGRRTVLLILDVENASQIPSLAEPWFNTFNADVEIHPVMTLDEMKNAGLDAVGKKWAS